MQGSWLVIQVGSSLLGTASGLGKAPASASQVAFALKEVVGVLGNSLLLCFHRPGQESLSKGVMDRIPESSGLG